MALKSTRYLKNEKLLEYHSNESKIICSFNFSLKTQNFKIRTIMVLQNFPLDKTEKTKENNNSNNNNNENESSKIQL